MGLGSIGLCEMVNREGGRCGKNGTGTTIAYKVVIIVFNSIERKRDSIKKLRALVQYLSVVPIAIWHRSMQNSTIDRCLVNFISVSLSINVEFHVGHCLCYD